MENTCFFAENTYLKLKYHTPVARFMLPTANAQNAPAQGGRNIVVGEQQSLFVFACLFAKTNVLCLGIANMALKKPTCVSDCNDFVCFGVALACGADKLIAIGDSQTAPIRRKKCVGKEKTKNWLLSAETCLRRIVPKI